MVQITKVIKNSDSPSGRLDWKNRSPRWRISITQPDALVLLECIQYYITVKGLSADERYTNWVERLQALVGQIGTKLLTDKYEFPLFDDADFFSIKE